jgi:hypothetical protein
VSGTLAVIAKAPEPGRVKTRLCPPCTPGEAAAIAEAALRDTLAVVGSVTARRHVLVLDGTLPAWPEREGFDVIAQRGDGLAERLAAAFADLGGPAFLVAMDTPQLTAADLTAGLAALAHHDAVLGPATDGGYWGIGLRAAAPGVFDRVPMSRASTADAQRARLRALGLRWAELRPLDDVDTFADARRVAARARGSRFAAAVAAAAARAGEHAA